MASRLKGATEVALAGVLRLSHGDNISSVTQEDFDALERHDEAVLASLDVNEQDAVKALKPWLDCLGKWARLKAPSREELWPIMTQPASVVLSKTSDDDESDIDTNNKTQPTPRSSSSTLPLPAHRALLPTLFRLMLLGGAEDVQDSPHRQPAPAAWLAARAYLLMLSLPGAGAYGVLQPAAVGLVLTNLRSWCRNSSVHRGAGGSNGGGGGGGGLMAAAKGSQKRRRRGGGGVAIGEDSGGEDGDESDEEEEGLSSGRRRAGARSGRNGGGGGGAGGGRGDVDEVQECLWVLKACVCSVPFTSHQDLLVKLSEVLVGISVVAAVNGPAALAELASSTILALVRSGLSCAGGGGGGGGGSFSGGGCSGNGSAEAAVLQALMPVILMASGKGDVPSRSKDCLKAHDNAIRVATDIATALKRARQQQQELTKESQTSDQIHDEAEKSPLRADEDRDENSTSPPRDDSIPSLRTQDRGGGEMVKGNEDDGGAGGKKTKNSLHDPPRFRPVLTMVQHLCVAAPERAEGRARLASGIAALLPVLEEMDRTRFVAFLAKFSRGSRINHRGFAVELSARLVMSTWPWAVSNNSNGRTLESSPDCPGEASHGGDGGRASPVFKEGADGGGGGGGSVGGGGVCGGKTMLYVIVARAGDSAPTVRAKAAATLVDILTTVQRTQQQGGHHSSGAGGALREAVMEAAGWGQEMRSGLHGGSRGEGPLLAVVRARVEDEKANVRRNAVPALEALLALSPALAAAISNDNDYSGGGDGGALGWRDSAVEHDNDILLLEGRCNDVSLSTRKAAMTALSSLLVARPEDEDLQQAWVRAMLPLAGDPEQTCQTRLVELVRTVLLDRVVDWHKAEIIGVGKAKQRGTAKYHQVAAGTSGIGKAKVVTSGEEKRIFSVWSLLAKAGQGDAHKCLKKVVFLLLSQKDSGFKAASVLNALRSAAVMALPPKAISSDGDCEELDGDVTEAGDWDASDLKLLSFSQSLPGAQLTTIRRGTWALLEAFLDRSTSPNDSGGKDTSPEKDMDPLFVVRCWSRIRGHILQEAFSKGESVGDNLNVSPEFEEAFEADGRRVLGVLARLAPSVPPEVATPMADTLLEMLLELVTTPEMSAAIVGALHKLCFAKAASEKDGAIMCNAWANHALSTFEEVLHSFVYQGCGALTDHAGARACGFNMARLVERLLFAVGEVVVVGFTGKEDAAGPSDPQAPGAENAADIVTVRPRASQQLVKLVQVLLPPRLPTTAHGVEDGQEGPMTPPAVRALAFVTLGKLCLRDKVLAKNSVNILVRELDTADDPAVRSNALIVLGDLCVRYTAMVDRHVGAMAACLQDPHPLVRRHAILLISQLLLQDYVKWRGLLLYRFVATLVDVDVSVKDLGFFTLTRPLINKNPGLFAQNFVEALFVLNNYSEHPCYTAAGAGRADSDGGVTMEGIDLGGDSPAQVGKRMAVYLTMLEHMSDEQKITVTAKLAQEVLSAAVEGGLPIATNSSASGVTKNRVSSSLSTAVAAMATGEHSICNKDADFRARKKASAVLKDALTILASSGIRVGGPRGAAAGDVDDGSEEMTSQQSGAGGLAAAKSKLLSKVSLKHLMEAVVPVMTALKHVLERAHSPLLRELMFYFRELFRSHKEEVTGVLASEPGLVDEIEFDLRRFEKEEQDKRRAREAAMAAAAAAMASNMCPPRTPRGRRSMGGAGGTPGTIRTPTVAAVLQSARKTPFQNLGECSGIKLKRGFNSPSLARGIGGGGRGPAPRTPLQLRTPRQAVAAALGESPMNISPVKMRGMSAAELDNKKCSSIEKLDDNGKVRSETSLDDDGIPADVSVPVPEEVPAKKKRRWEVSVPPPTEESGSGLDDDDKDRRSAGEEEYDSHGEGGVEDRGGKENDPRGRNASEEVLVERKVGRGSEAGEGEKGKGTVEEEVQKRSGRTKAGRSKTSSAKSAKISSERPLRRGKNRS